MKINRKYILLVSDALIPLLGFFYFGWNLYFILLFYFIDVFAQEVIMHIKSKKIITAQNITNKNPWIKSGLLSFISVVAMIALIHCVMLVIDPSVDFLKQIELFWRYEEMGIQQGYVLIPLVAFTVYQQFKMDFIARRMERIAELEIEWKKHLRALLFILGFTGITLWVSQLIVFQEVVYVIGIVVVISTYTLLVKK